MEKQNPGQTHYGYKPAQITILVILLIFFFPAGIIYTGWLIGRKKGLCCAAGCILLPILLILIYCWAVTQSDFGENCSRVDWLNDEAASDVSYYRSYMWTAYEYKTTEENFRKYANPFWKFEEIRKPVRVPRYLDYKNGFDPDSGALVKNGIIASERRSNGGGYIAVYDRDSGKAYVQHNPR